MPTVREILDSASPAGGPWHRDARALLAHVLGVAGPLSLSASKAVSDEEQTKFLDLFARRISGEPLQYVLEEWDFFGRRFRVDRRALIPRPETEHLVEEALRCAPDARRIADLGCGSGILAVTLACEIPGSRLVASDASFASLALARENARRLAVAERIRLVAGDWLAPVGDRAHFDLVVANPPYVAENERDQLPRLVRDYEPAAALFAGGDGLSEIRRLVESVPACVTVGGFFLFEFGFGQSPLVEDLLRPSAPWSLERIVADLAGIPRVAVLQRREAV